jgi:hypothetical protein
VFTWPWPNWSVIRSNGKRSVLGFAGAFRISEVVASNVKDLEFCDEGVRVTIRRWKTDQEGKGQTIAILPGDGTFCPVRLLREWLDAAGVTEGALLKLYWEAAQGTTRRSHPTAPPKVASPLTKMPFPHNTKTSVGACLRK